MVGFMNREALDRTLETGRGLVLEPGAAGAVAQGGHLRATTSTCARCAATARTTPCCCWPTRRAPPATPAARTCYFRTLDGRASPAAATGPPPARRRRGRPATWTGSSPSCSQPGAGPGGLVHRAAARRGRRPHRAQDRRGSGRGDHRGQEPRPGRARGRDGRPLVPLPGAAAGRRTAAGETSTASCASATGRSERDERRASRRPGAAPKPIHYLPRTIQQLAGVASQTGRRHRARTIPAPRATSGPPTVGVSSTWTRAGAVVAAPRRCGVVIGTGSCVEKGVGRVMEDGAARNEAQAQPPRAPAPRRPRSLPLAPVPRHEVDPTVPVRDRPRPGAGHLPLLPRRRLLAGRQRAVGLLPLLRLQPGLGERPLRGHAQPLLPQSGLRPGGAPRQDQARAAQLVPRQAHGERAQPALRLSALPLRPRSRRLPLAGDQLPATFIRSSRV